MTKKQVLASIRERIDYVRGVSEREISKVTESCDLYSYYKGRVDAYDFVLEILSDYD